MSTTPTPSASPWPPTQLPLSDTEIEVEFMAHLSDASDVLLKHPYSEATQKATNDVLLLCAAIIAMCLGIVTPDGVTIGAMSFKPAGAAVLVTSLLGALLYVVWVLKARVDTDFSLYEYKQASAVARLGFLSKALTEEISRLNAEGTLRSNGTLHEKVAYIEELIPRIRESPRLARRITFTYPALLAAIALGAGVWFVVLAVRA